MSDFFDIMCEQQYADDGRGEWSEECIIKKMRKEFADKEKQAIKQRLIDAVMDERKSTEGLKQAEATSRLMFNAGLGKAVELIEKVLSNEEN